MNKFTVKYDDMDFVWIVDHWNIHLEGLCRYNGSLCRFKTNEETEICTIYSLSILEKVKWLVRKKRFELCIGYHWTYPHKSHGALFYYRKPKWLYKFLFKKFYRNNQDR